MCYLLVISSAFYGCCELAHSEDEAFEYDGLQKYDPLRRVPPNVDFNRSFLSRP